MFWIIAFDCAARVDRAPVFLARLRKTRFEASAQAVQGNADAQFFLGSIYLLPQKDIGEGLKWLRLSAEQGMQDAQLLLGKAYMEGSKELPRDPVQGICGCG